MLWHQHTVLSCRRWHWISFKAPHLGIENWKCRSCVLTEFYCWPIRVSRLLIYLMISGKFFFHKLCPGLLAWFGGQSNKSPGLDLTCFFMQHRPARLEACFLPLPSLEGVGTTSFVDTVLRGFFFFLLSETTNPFHCEMLWLCKQDLRLVSNCTIPY